MASRSYRIKIISLLLNLPFLEVCSPHSKTLAYFSICVSVSKRTSSLIFLKSVPPFRRVTNVSHQSVAPTRTVHKSNTLCNPVLRSYHVCPFDLSIKRDSRKSPVLGQCKIVGASCSEMRATHSLLRLSCRGHLARASLLKRGKSCLDKEPNEY